MTEEEKRALALAFMEAEKQRLATTRFHDVNKAELDAVVRNAARRNEILSSFEQQGITFQQFQQAYNDAYERGRSDMLAFRFSFFYAATAIAYHEIFSAEPEETSVFMKALPKAPEGCANHAPGPTGSGQDAADGDYET